ncbi:hypothetical protein VE04_08022 [Pseudogymnoascus sp. 24MN13]|nr:hypothetical protein VE04_08022 [Pseudogymnoascus sp. 24MN13]
MESSVKMPKTPLAESIRGHRRMTSRSDSTHAPSKTLGDQSSKCPKPQPSVAGSMAHLPFTTASFQNLRHGLRDSNALLAPFQTRDFSALRWVVDGIGGTSNARYLARRDLVLAQEPGARREMIQRPTQYSLGLQPGDNAGILGYWWKRAESHRKRSLYELMSAPYAA